MNIDAAFPSKYLKAHDLLGKTVRLKIAGITVEKLGEDLRPIISFSGTDKTLVVNKTNANRISASYGRETDDWIGKDIEVYPDQVEFQGRMVEAIRVRVPAKPPQQANPAFLKSAGPEVTGKFTMPAAVTGHLDAPTPAGPEVYGAVSLADELNDSIPFAPEWR